MTQLTAESAFVGVLYAVWSFKMNMLFTRLFCKSETDSSFVCSESGFVLCFELFEITSLSVFRCKLILLHNELKRMDNLLNKSWKTNHYQFDGFLYN